MTKLTRAITPDEIATYRVAGVVLLKNILDISAINTVRRSIDTAVNTLDESKNGYNLSAITAAAEKNDAEALNTDSKGQHDVSAIIDHVKSTGKPFLYDKTETSGHGNFLLDTAVSSRLREFNRFVRRGACPEIAAALLESKKVNFFGDQVFVKEPGTRERTAFHQDATYFEIEGDQCCVLWIPTDPVTLEHGAMMYVRGSHKDGRLYQPNVFISQASLPGAEGELLPNIEDHMDDYDVVHFDTEPGDVLVHHYRTVHGTGGNTSRYQVRRAASLRYCGDDVRIKRRAWAPKQLHHSNNLSDGMPLSGVDFPVVWREANQEANQLA